MKSLKLSKESSDAGDGRHAAYHILRWSKNQACTDPEGFTQAMIEMFKVEAQINTPEGIELDRVCLLSVSESCGCLYCWRISLSSALPFDIVICWEVFI